MKKINCIIITFFFISALYAQTDSLNNIIKFNLDLNNLVKGKGFEIGYIGFEKALCKKSSLVLWLGYDFTSSNLIVDKVENVVHSQKLRIKLDYRYHFLDTKTLQGFYTFSSLNYNMSMTNQDNERIFERGILFGLGYQQICKQFALDFQIDKGYCYSTFKNNGMKLLSSTITPFNLTFSVGYIF